MTKLERLKKTKSLHDIALWLDYKPKTLSYILYKIPDDHKYDEFTIEKKHGGKRKIKAPTPLLKQLQKKLATALCICFEEIRKKHLNSIKNHKQSKSFSHGFRKNHSIITNATNHTNHRYVFNIDLKDFFPSINFGRVRGFFIKSSDFELDPKVATIIAQIACHDNSLPQGSPCSPVISNLIGHLVDIRMANVAKRAGCTYSRYADDLTFSTKNKNFPSSIAFLVDIEKNLWAPSEKITGKIKKLGFTINDNKTSMQYKTSRQLTTGLVVNKKVNIKNEYYKQTRSMCYSLFKTGSYYFGHVFDPNQRSAATIENETKDDSNIEQKQGNLNQLGGILNYIYHVKTYNQKKTKLSPQEIENRRLRPNAITKLFREFLFYKHFFSLSQPLIITEGKTDVVYLKCALKSLYKKYKPLIEKGDDGFKLSLSFLKWSNTFVRVCSGAKGTSGQGHLIDLYDKSMKSFQGNGKAHPVIFLIDNDSGSIPIFNRFKATGDRNRDFYHLKENLYVVATPFCDKGKDTLIEDFFDPELLKKKLNGKTLNLDNQGFDKEKNYSKTVFAENVIGKNQENVDFDKFRPILDRIVAAIEDYKSKQIEE